MFEEKLPATTVKDVESLGAKVKEYEKRLAAYSNLEVCEAKIVEQELKLANSILKIQLEAAINRAEIVERLAETVFKNRTLTITKSGNIPMVDPNSGCSMTGYTNEQITQEEG